MQRKPKILFVTPLPPPVHGSSMVSDFIRKSELIHEDFDCDYVNLSTSRAMREIGKQSYALYAKKALRFIGSYLKMLWLLLTHRYESTYLAITVHDIGFLKDFPFVLMARLLSKNYVIHQHNRGMAPYVNRKPWCWFLPMAYKKAKVILLSWRLYDDISAVVRRDQVMICPNGLPMPECLADIQKKENKVPEILFLGNLVESKGVYVLLDALKLLHDKGVSFHCSFVGGTSRFIGAEKFAEGASQRGLSGIAEYLGPQYGDDKWKAYKQADIFVLPSMDDCLPLTIIEAMMCGIPVVSTTMGAIPDLVEDGKTGYIISSEDLIVETGGKFLDWEPTAEMAQRIAKGDPSCKGTTALADRLETLLINSELRKQMGEAGHERYNQLFTLEAFEKRMCECLREMIKT